MVGMTVPKKSTDSISWGSPGSLAAIRFPSGAALRSPGMSLVLGCEHIGGAPVERVCLEASVVGSFPASLSPCPSSFPSPEILCQRWGSPSIFSPIGRGIFSRV